jgi:hypothetical protein
MKIICNYHSFEKLVELYYLNYLFHRLIQEMRSYAVSMFPQTIFILVIYFLSTPRMSFGQTYQSGKELVSYASFYSYSKSYIKEGKVGSIMLHSF